MKTPRLLLRKGDSGDAVVQLQTNLYQLGYAVTIDGFFGPDTSAVVSLFQRDHNLNADCIVGPKTQAAIRKALKHVDESENVDDADQYIVKHPPSYAQLFDVFDDFRVPGWQEAYLVKCDLSFATKRLAHVKIGWADKPAFSHRTWFGFRCHKYVVPHMQKAFEGIVFKEAEQALLTFDGCFNIRYMRSSAKWSTHSWAIAIDLNARWNRFGHTQFNMDRRIVDAFESAGFTWGGRWHYLDAMHFQFCKS